MDVNKFMKRVHENAIEKGWHNEAPNVPEKLALIHSEVSEALEEYRSLTSRDLYYGPDGKPEGIAAELADVVIRVFDLATALGLPLERALDEKATYNEGRQYRHGGKRC